jgi:hypothetical protein
VASGSAFQSSGDIDAIAINASIIDNDIALV